jgi:hypothetical protein
MTAVTIHVNAIVIVGVLEMSSQVTQRFNS